MDPLQGLLDTYSKGLQPMKPFTTDVMPFNTFAKPLQSFVNSAAESYKPWYEYFNAAPQKNTLRNAGAANNSNMTGFGKDVMQRNLRQIYQPLNDQLYGSNGITEQYNQNYINPLYNQRIGQYYKSPLTGFNYNNF